MEKNIPLAIFLNHFDVKAFEELLEQDTVNSILWNQIVKFIVDDIPSIDPFNQRL